MFLCICISTNFCRTESLWRILREYEWNHITLHLRSFGI